MKHENAKQLWKRRLSMGLSLAMAVTMLPVGGLSAKAEEGDAPALLKARSTSGVEGSTYTRNQPFIANVTGTTEDGAGRPYFGAPAFTVFERLAFREDGEDCTYWEAETNSTMLITAAEGKFDEEKLAGGTDIVAMILKKYSTVNIGTALFLVDLMITVAACFIFDAQTGLFSFCGLMAKSLVIDGAIENINLCKYFTIVCDDPEPICDFIHEKLTRSATIFQAEGTYTHNRKYVILTVMKRGQAVQLRNYIKLNEPSAFMMITNSSEIIGKGFRGLN